MGIKQNVVGKQAEIKTAKYFQQKRYWAFIIPKGVNGQPFDIIAGRRNNTFYVDAKHLDSDFFPFNRIEPNQISSMQYAYKVAEIKDNLGFIINKEEDFYFLPYIMYVTLKEEGHKGVNISKLEKLEIILERLENGNTSSK